jgi:hypothetical protein
MVVGEGVVLVVGSGVVVVGEGVVLVVGSGVGSGVVVVGEGVVLVVVGTGVVVQASWFAPLLLPGAHG